MPRIAAGDADAIEDLYLSLQRRFSYGLLSALGPDDAADRLHEAFIAVLESIRLGRLRDPWRIMGYARTIVQRGICAAIGVRTADRQWAEPSDAGHVPDRRPTPEQAVLRAERLAAVRAGLARLRPGERSLLLRFYFDGQPKERICAELNLTETQFRLNKSRAKQRLCAIMRASRMNRPPARADSQA